MVTRKTFFSTFFALSVMMIGLFVTAGAMGQDRTNRMIRVIRESQNIVVGKVTSSVAQWRNDEYGRHIYTTYTVEVTHNIRGRHFSSLSVEVRGGTVDDLNEFISSELYLAEQETYIMFFNEFPVRFRDPDHSVMQVYMDYCNVLGRDVRLHSFLDVIRKIDRRPETKDNELIQMLQSLISASGDQGMTNPSKYQAVEPGQFQAKKDIVLLEKSSRLNEDCADDFVPESTIGNIVYHQYKTGHPHDHDDDGYLSWRTHLFFLSTNDGSTLTGFLYIYSKTSGTSESYQFHGSYSSSAITITPYTYESFIRFIEINGTHSSYNLLSHGTYDFEIRFAPLTGQEVVLFNSSSHPSLGNVNVETPDEDPPAYPVINSITPGECAAGVNCPVKISGQYFGESKGYSEVYFYYRPGIPRIKAPIVSWSDTLIECYVPTATVQGYPGSAGSGPVKVIVVTPSNTVKSSAGFNFSVTFSSSRMRWEGESPVVPFKINANTPDCSGEATAVINATDSWNGVGSGITFLYDGTHTNTTSSRDSVNTIQWTNNPWGPFLAASTVFSNASTGCIKEVDITFNDLYDWSSSAIPVPDAYDIRSIALHEFGHWLCLWDLYGDPDQQKVMYGIGYPGVLKQTLQKADTMGILYKYGIILTISGSITDASDNPLSGVQVCCIGLPGDTIFSDANGYYSFEVPYGFSGKVKAITSCYHFLPESLSYNNLQQSLSGQDMVADVLFSPVVHGTITNNAGEAVEGVDVVFPGPGGGTVTTDADGEYAIMLGCGYTGTAIPSKACHTFSPSASAYAHLVAQSTEQDYVATSYSPFINGTLTTATGDPVSGISIVFSGPGGGTVTTDENGYYSFQVPCAYSGTASPAHPCYSVVPPSRAYQNVGNNINNQNYSVYTQTRTVSGYIIDFNVNPLAGVTVHFSGQGGGDVTTDAGGFYSKTVPCGYTGTVTPSMLCKSFTPLVYNFSNLTTNQDELNFWASHTTKDISGSILDSSGNPMSNVSITFSSPGGGTVMTDGSGHYSITVPCGYSGTAVPEHSCYDFSPPGIQYSGITGSMPDQDYTAHIQYYTISGSVFNTTTLAPISGASVTFWGSGGGVAVTNTSGNYSFEVPCGYSGHATAFKLGYSFTPALWSYQDVQADISGKNYGGSVANRNISGIISDAGGNPAGSVDVVFSGAGGGTVTTNANGYYSKSVPFNYSGTATPEKECHSFSPALVTYSEVTVNQSNQNYTISDLSPLISGTVTNSTGEALSGVNILFSGSGGGSVITNASGYYSITVPCGYSGSASLQYPCYEFIPAGRMYNNLTTHADSQDYAGIILQYVISGTVFNAATLQPISGATITFWGNGGGVATTNSSGNYSFSVPCGYSGYATAFKLGYSFTPILWNYTDVNANISGKNYAGTYKTFNITGLVTDNTGDPVSDATVTFGGSGGGSVTTNASGYYSKSVPYNYSGTATPAKACLVFSPENRLYTEVTSHQSNQDYSAQPFNPVISGVILDDEGNPLSGVSLTFSGTGGGTVFTDNNGFYSKTVPCPYSGTVSVSKTCFVFDPPGMNYTNITQSIDNHDYTASGILVPISGFVRDSLNNGISGVTMIISGDGGGTAMTSLSGYFSFSVPCGYSGSVSPEKSCFTFVPEVRYLINVNNPLNNLNFTAIQETVSLSGTLRDSSDQPVAGITITFGTSGQTAITNSLGEYIVTLPCGFSGKVKPLDECYSYFPGLRSLSNVTTNLDSLDFTATLQMVPVSFKTLQISEFPIVGTQIEISGDCGVSGTTDGLGIWASEVPCGCSGTVTFTHLCYEYDPDSIDLVNVTEAVSMIITGTDPDSPEAPLTPVGIDFIIPPVYSVSYGVPEIEGAISYEWIYSGSNVSINDTGQNVTLDFLPGATSGVLKVRGIGQCSAGVWSPGLAITVEPMEPPALTIADTGGYCDGSMLAVPVYASGITDMVLFQFYIEYDPAILQYDTCDDWGGGVNPDSLSITDNPTDGVLSFHYYGDTVNLSEGMFFTLHFHFMDGPSSEISWTQNQGPALFMHASTALVTGVYTDGSAVCLPPPLILTTTAEPSEVCEGEAVILHAFPTGGSGNYSFSWESDPPGFTSSEQHPQLIPDVNTVYTVTVNDGLQQTSGFAEVTVHPLPVITFSISPDVVCDNSPAVALSATPSGGTFEGEGVSGDLFNPGLVDPGEVAITYHFTDENGCDANQADFITVLMAPLVDAGEDQEILPGMSVQLQPTVTGGQGVLQYSWSPPDGLDDPFIANPFATPPFLPFTYTLTVTDEAGCQHADQLTITEQTGGQSGIYGQLAYSNLSNTPLGNTEVSLYNNLDELIGTTSTGTDGSFVFNGVEAGDYYLLTQTNIPWGGANAVDALLSLQHFTGFITLLGLPLVAADVTGEGNINAIDGLSILKRFVSLIDTFPSGDWYFEIPEFTIDGVNNMMLDYHGICFGDINQSYLPGFKSQASLYVSYLGTGILQPDGSMIIPVFAASDMMISSMSLILNVPEVIDIVQIISGLPGEFAYHSRNGETRIGWYNLEPFQLQPMDLVLTIHARMKESVTDCDLTIDPESNVSDENARIIRGGLILPSLSNVQPENRLEVFPNPVNAVSVIRYFLQNSGNVSLRLFNVYGQLVKELVNEENAAGVHSISLDNSHIQAGTYFIRLSSGGLILQQKMTVLSHER